MRKTINDIDLSKYFQKKLKNNNKIPPIRTIANETNISLSTISRFAKRKGFFDFPELRREMNKSLEISQKNHESIKILKNMIDNKAIDKIIIVPSSFTYIIGFLIKTRLSEFLNKKVILTDKIDFSEVTNKTFFIFTSISGIWAEQENFFKSKLINKSILISYKQPKLKNNYSKSIVFDWEIPTNRIEEFQLVDKMYHSLSKIMISLYAEYKS